MSNRRWVGVILLLLVVIGGGFAIGATAYHAGFVHGAVNAGARVVYARPYGYGWGFFPFGLFLFPLFFILLLMGIRLLVFGGARRRWDGGGWGGPGGPGPVGPGSPGGDWRTGRERIEAWHREAHEREARGGTAPPSTPANFSA